MITSAACRELVTELRQAREQAGLSMAALAARTPYSKSSWERYLNGKKPIPRPAVEALCLITGGPAERLLALWELADAAWSGRGQHLGAAVPPAAVTAPGGGPASRRGRWAASAGAAVALVLTVLGVSIAGARQDPPMAAAEPLVRNPGCTAEACEGRNPVDMGCGGSGMVRTLTRRIASGGQRLELRHAEVCRALWVRATGLRTGDRVDMLFADGRSQHVMAKTGPEAGKYLSTPMSSDTGRARVRMCLKGMSSGREECFPG
ncbi:helix-turn-helix domain-containing protein [Streptomyces ficellus]|uniref:Helix-turn-helix domain-containing protein n=1 Tax=Streptomyces ficellus TaxID=1977088 RepID=A0ABT7Z8I9_9ACTN|nr:XRE family transcriptional regulator [Streptomyces ficellus]MDN3295817.1 helix-turn-helix domain-containing protein [Streptomyces ficellus]